MATRIGMIGPDHRSHYRFSGFRMLYRGFLSVGAYMVDGVGHPMEALHKGHAVVALPIDPVKRIVYLIRHPRFNQAFAMSPEAAALLDAALAGDTSAAAEIDANAFMSFELPAGMIDPGEDPAAAALRELREETGITIGPERLTPAVEYFPSSGGCTEFLTTFIADVSGRQPVLDGAHGDGNESIELWRMSYEEAWDMVDHGEITAAGTLLLLERLRSKELRDQLTLERLKTDELRNRLAMKD